MRNWNFKVRLNFCEFLKMQYFSMFLETYCSRCRFFEVCMIFLCPLSVKWKTKFTDQKKRFTLSKNCQWTVRLSIFLVLRWCSMVYRFLHSAEIWENIEWKNAPFRFAVPNLSYYSKRSMLYSNSRHTLLSVIKAW